LFQKAILSLQFEIPAHISKQLIFKFQAQDSFLEWFFWEIGRFEKRISLSEKRQPLLDFQVQTTKMSFLHEDD